MSRFINSSVEGTAGNVSVVRQDAHDLLDMLLDQLLAEQFFGVGTLELASQNGKLCKCEADLRHKLRPRRNDAKHHSKGSRLV